MMRAGLIGLGKMGISHHAILNAHPEVDLVAVCDRSQYILGVLSKYTGIKTYTDYQEMIDAERLDCVLVAAPSQFHVEMVRYALEHDLHVFCEKPFCLDIREGQALIELARKKGLVNQVGYHYRHAETFREAKRLVDAGVLGDLHHLRAEAYGPVALRASGSTWRSSRANGGGCLYDYACHAIDLITFTVGTPVAVSGVSLNKIFSRDVDDEVYASFHFAHGLTAQLAANWSDESHRKMSTRLTIWGTNGHIAADRQECQIYLRAAVSTPEPLGKGWTIRYTTDLTNPVWFYLRGEEYSRQIDYFVQNVQGKVTNNESSFASAFETDKVVHAMLAAVDNGRAAVGAPQFESSSAIEPRSLFPFLR